MVKSSLKNSESFKVSLYLYGQVLYDQLLQNLPGWEHSKSMWS